MVPVAHNNSNAAATIQSIFWNISEESPNIMEGLTFAPGSSCTSFWLSHELSFQHEHRTDCFHVVSRVVNRVAAQREVSARPAERLRRGAVVEKCI